MRILLLNIIFALLLSACEKDREFVKDLYFSQKMYQDLEKNRDSLYRNSYVGVHKNIEDEEYY